ncbi:transketolase, partial [Arthrobacter sp. ISL-72]|uniref:transketolase n=1 Tax=Arthrobacter sp. ISL-72 TaxID=2819114 RepID=UPI001C1812C8
MLTADASQAAAWRSLRQEVLDGDPATRAAKLHERAQATRRSILKMISDAGQGHIGGDFSVTDILTVLFDAVMNVDPEDPRKEDRDHFILSKGHCAGALYSTLAHSGFFPVSELDTFMAPLSALNGHPNRVKVPGVETNTGPLGHGLPVAVGTAIGAKLLKSGSRVFVVTGDGEMQEGSNWEALMSASHQKLDNLTVVVDRNRL